MLKKKVLEDIQQLQKSQASWISASKLEKMIELIKQEANENLADRSTALHFSASALVFKEDKLFFIYHPYLKTTLLPAGHVEAGETPEQAARREFQEETGFAVDSLKGGQLVDVNLFNIPANPLKNEGSHHHLDFRYHFALNDQKPGSAELDFKLLTRDQAPEEFQVYFQLL